MATKNNTNPWLGILPYSKDTDLTVHPFRGRDKETKDLYRLVTNNAITTLYGRSGVGKSSLLQAGLFPLLSKEGYSPILLRLHTECGEGDSFAQCIVKCLQPLAVLRNGCKYEKGSANEDDYLWRFMAYHQFAEDDNKKIPVLVLDQFEEVLRSSSDKASKLLRQLRATLNDGYLPNGEMYKIGFRILISLREDDLYLLEDLLDKDSIDQLKQCRYRLRDVDMQNAKQIIEIRDGLFDKKEEEACCDKLLEQATNDGQISTLVLSLLCFRAYEKAKGNPICLKDISNNVSDTSEPRKKKKQSMTVSALEDFYNEATKELNDNEQKYLLENSVTEDGRRKRMKGDVLKAKLPNDFDRLTNENSQHHIFTIASGEKEKDTYYELIHDQIAAVVYNKRQGWEAQRRARRIKQLLIAVLSLAAFVILMCITIPALMRSTIPLDPTKLHPGDTIYAAKRPYYVKGGKLDLDSIYVEPGALLGIKNVHYIITGDNNCLGYYFPEADTVDIEFNSFHILHPDSLIQTFPNVRCIILGNSGIYTTACSHIPTLQSVVAKNKDFKWHRGTLFVCYHKDGPEWYPIVTNNLSVDSISYIDTVFANHIVHNARAIRVFDLANPPIVRDSLDRYILTCSDRNIKSIGQSDIEDIMDKGQIYEADLPYVTKIDDRAFSSAYNMRSAKLPNAIEIGRDAFSRCFTLQNIDLPNAERIGIGAFCGCTSLQSVNLPNAERIGGAAFMDCRLLQSVNLPKVKSIGDIFYTGTFRGCKSLRSVVLPNLTEIVGTETFEFCDSLESVLLPKVTKINIENINTSHFYNPIAVSMPILDTLFITTTKFDSPGLTIYIPQNAITYNPNSILYSYKIEKKKMIKTPSGTIGKNSTNNSRHEYYNVCDSILTITDSVIPYLHIPKGVKRFRGYIPGTTSIKHIVVSPFNPKVIIHKFGMIVIGGYHNDNIVLCDRRRQIVRFIYGFSQQTPSSRELVVAAGTSMDRCKEMFYYLNDGKRQFEFFRPHDLLVPYGRYDIFASLESKPYIGKVVEMGWFETLWYRMIGLAELTYLPYLVLAIIVMAVTLGLFLFQWHKRR